MKLFLICSGLALIVVVIWNRFKRYSERMAIESQIFSDELKKSLEKSAEETMKMKSGETPSDEDIDKYYRMYCKKFELDTEDEWTTAELLTFEEFEKDAKDKGYRFLISMTSDAFSFDPSTGQSVMWRYIDYESMIDEDYHFDQETINKQLDIE